MHCGQENCGPGEGCGKQQAQEEAKITGCNCTADGSDEVILEKHQSGCMVCGAELVYQQEESKVNCHYCGKSFSVTAVCKDGHYVCDNCHSQDAVQIIESVCLNTKETDMIALLGRIRSHNKFPVHGPEHHGLVPGIILATYRNLGGKITDEMICRGIRRGAQIPGGQCGYMGACGAALGVGIGFGIILDSNPTNAQTRQRVLQVTTAALEKISAQKAARCCQRESWLALKTGAEISDKYLPIKLKADELFQCEQMQQNAECMGISCPIFPRVSKCCRKKG